MRRLLAMTVLGLGLLAGCTDGDGGMTDTTPGTGEFLATASAEQVAAAQDALEVYRKYIDAVVEARSDPTRVPPELEEYSTDQALADELSWLVTLQEQGVVFEGEPSLHPEVVDVSLESGTVTLVDCEDSAGWLPVDVVSGDSRAAPGQPTSVKVNVTIRRSGGSWIVSESRADRSEPC